MIFMTVFSLFAFGTIFGVRGILWSRGIPHTLIFDVHDNYWRIAEYTVMALTAISALTHLIASPEYQGISIFILGSIPYFLFMLARCIALVCAQKTV